MYVNGNSITGNTYQIDGTTANSWSSGLATDSTSNVAAGLAVPNPDAIAEFSVQTALYDATFGRNPGANVNLVTKSGTNNIHGSAFEFLRNDVFNASDFFRNAAGQSRPVMKQNQFEALLAARSRKIKCSTLSLTRNSAKKWIGFERVVHLDPAGFDQRSLGSYNRGRILCT